MVGAGERGFVFAVDSNRSVKGGPVENLGDVRGFHIDTAVGHGHAEIVVPISAVKAEAKIVGKLGIAEKENIGNVGKVIVST